MDSIVGEDPFSGNNFWSPKFGDCDKGVTQMEITSTPDSLGKSKSSDSAELRNQSRRLLEKMHLYINPENFWAALDEIQLHANKIC